MKVYVSVDMEGVAGVATLDQIVRGGSGYPRAQELMTAEAAAAVRGAYAGGATEVVVSDGHGTMDNLLVDRLPPDVRIVTGGPRPSCMAQGLEADAALAVFVGYHAAAGAPGVLSHTFSINFTELRLNGRPVSEAEINGLYAAARGVPVGLITGDDEICAVAGKAFPGVRTVVTKWSVGWSATESLHPAAACTAIEEGLRSAVRGAGDAVPLPVPADLELEADLATPLAAEMAASAPGTVRRGGRTVLRRAHDVDDLITTIVAWYHLAGVAALQVSAVAHRR